MCARSPCMILRRVSPSTSASSASAASLLPAASGSPRLWPFCTASLKFQGCSEQRPQRSNQSAFIAREIFPTESVIVCCYRSLVASETSRSCSTPHPLRRFGPPRWNSPLKTSGLRRDKRDGGTLSSFEIVRAALGRKSRLR